MWNGVWNAVESFVANCDVGAVMYAGFGVCLNSEVRRRQLISYHQTESSNSFVHSCTSHRLITRLDSRCIHRSKLVMPGVTIPSSPAKDEEVAGSFKYHKVLYI